MNIYEIFLMNLDHLVECVIHTVSVVNNDAGIHVKFFILDHERKHLALMACGTNNFILDGMRQQNIIDNVNVFDSNDMKKDDTKNKLFYLVSGRQLDSKENLSWAWKLVEERIEKMKSSKEIMVEIEAVSGAYVLLTANRLLLSVACEFPSSEIPNSTDLILWEFQNSKNA